MKNLISLTYFLLFLYPSIGNCGDLVVVGCNGGQVLIVKIGEIKSYDQRNDMSFPADLDFIKLQNLHALEEMDPNQGKDYCIDLSSKNVYLIFRLLGYEKSHFYVLFELQT